MNKNITAIILLLLCVFVGRHSSSAWAGHWEISYPPATQYVHVLSMGSDYHTGPQDVPYDQLVDEVGAVWDGNVSLARTEVTYRARLTWVLDEPLDAFRMPEKVSVIEHSHASRHAGYSDLGTGDFLLGLDPDGVGNITGLAVNGFNTPESKSGDPNAGSPPNWEWVSDKLKRKIIWTFPGTYTYDLSSRCISYETIAPAADLQTWYGVGTYYYVMFDGPSKLSAWSTHCAPSLGGTDPAWVADNPRYFSGTGCEVGALATPVIGDVQFAALKINGTVVATYSKQLGDGFEFGQTVPISVRFDSTHFIDGTAVLIELDVTDGAGEQIPVYLQALAYNKALAINNNNDIESFGMIDGVRNGLSNYTISGGAWEYRDSILQKIGKNTVFYSATHGDVAVIGDCYSQPHSDDSHWIWYTDASDQIGSKPISSPPYNFGWFDACYVFGDCIVGIPDNGAMALGFGIPEHNAKDRASMGYNRPLYIHKLNTAWTVRTGTYLGQGLSLEDAVLKSTSVFPIICVDKVIDGIDIGWVPWHPTMFGDLNIKTRSVYLGSSGKLGDTERWYLQL